MTPFNEEFSGTLCPPACGTNSGSSFWAEQGSGADQIAWTQKSNWLQPDIVRFAAEEGGAG